MPSENVTYVGQPELAVQGSDQAVKFLNPGVVIWYLTGAKVGGKALKPTLELTVPVTGVKGIPKTGKHKVVGIGGSFHWRDHGAAAPIKMSIVLGPVAIGHFRTLGSAKTHLLEGVKIDVYKYVAEPKGKDVVFKWIRCFFPKDKAGFSANFAPGSNSTVTIASDPYGLPGHELLREATLVCHPPGGKKQDFTQVWDLEKGKQVYPWGSATSKS